MKRLAILGSTGTIGVNTLQIVAAHPERFSVVALTAGQNIDLLCEQVRQFRPEVVAVLSDAAAREVRARLGAQQVEVLVGAAGLKACACHDAVAMVVSAIVGAAGLVPTLAAVEAGKDIALANKETLVTAGELVMAAVARQQVAMLPVDSEHSAIFQALAGQRREDVRRLILTASGGPFRNHDLAALQQVTPAEALAHPNWSMGRKISIDSATMMNKGLEVIEAHWLFALPPEQIAVHIHPQSIVHSMVEYRDGSVLAQLGIPDMKGPIAYALAYPERLPLDLPPLDLCRLSALTFAEPDDERFPCLSLAYAALRLGGTAPAVLNAANEEAVAAFLEKKIAFLQIPRIIETALARHAVVPLSNLETALAAEAEGRCLALESIASIVRGVNPC